MKDELSLIIVLVFVFMLIMGGMFVVYLNYQAFNEACVAAGGYVPSEGVCLR